MDTKATHTQHGSQRRYVPGTSRGRHSATTLLAQVANIERGQRIKARREELHLTQPAVVDLLEEAAKELPETHELHPLKAGKPPVTLRGFQTYEQGGGIVWDKAKLLAQVLGMDVQAMMSGEPETGETPDLSRPANGQDALADRIDQLLEGQATVEQRLAEASREREQHAEEIRKLLKRQDGILKKIEDSIAAQQTAKAEADEATQRLLEAAGAASRIYEDAARRSEAVHDTQGT